MNDSKKFSDRFLRQPGSLIGSVVIVLCLFIAAFCYFLAPDSTPNANRIIPELANRRPGFQIDVLALKNGPPQQTSFFDRLINGKEDRSLLVPYTSLRQQRDSVVLSKYLDENLGERVAFANSALASDPRRHVRFALGSDRFGRDILSRLLVGVRVSLSVGAIAVLLSLTIGIFLGALAGYYRGHVDEAVMWLINVIWSIPTLLLVFALTLALGKGFWQVFIAVGLSLWVNVARLVRGQVIAARKLEYVDAAVVLGFSDTRILFRHILPNITGPILVLAANNFASAIVIEAGLSFLGLGVQPPQPSWGLMVKENYNFIITHNPVLALAPGIAIMLLVLAFNLVGSGLRDALSVRDN